MKYKLIINVLVIIIIIAATGCSMKIDDNIVEPSKEDNILTLKNIKELAQKGDELTWEDFREYKYNDIGSGLYVYAFPVDDKFELLIGGSNINEKPMYIYLKRTDKGNDDKIDIRYDDLNEILDNI